MIITQFPDSNFGVPDGVRVLKGRKEVSLEYQPPTRRVEAVTSKLNGGIIVDFSSQGRALAKKPDLSDGDTPFPTIEADGSSSTRNGGLVGEISQRKQVAPMQTPLKDRAAVMKSPALKVQAFAEDPKAGLISKGTVFEGKA